MEWLRSRNIRLKEEIRYSAPLKVVYTEYVTSQQFEELPRNKLNRISSKPAWKTILKYTYTEINKSRLTTNETNSEIVCTLEKFTIIL